MTVEAETVVRKIPNKSAKWPSFENLKGFFAVCLLLFILALILVAYARYTQPFILDSSGGVGEWQYRVVVPAKYMTSELSKHHQATFLLMMRRVLEGTATFEIERAPEPEMMPMMPKVVTPTPVVPKTTKK